MAQTEIRKSLEEIFRSVFNYSGPLADDTAPAQVPGWDSLGTMQLVFAVEERFSIEIPIGLIPELNTVAKIESFIEKESQQVG